MSGIEMLIPLVGAGLSAVVTGFSKLVSFFRKKPDDFNDTMRAIEERIRRQEEDRMRREADQRAREREELGRQREALSKRREADSKRRQDEARAIIMQKEKDCKEREAEADQRVQEREELARHREALSKRREDEAFAEAHKAKEALQKGIRPVVWPTREQFLAAKQRVQYDPAKFHFAVCGASGSGKSSLVNAFRGLKPSDEAAAKVGVTECTSKVTRYPDLRNEIPFSRFVWYDIPGAGTLNVPDWQYFNDQGLFVFDFIIVVYDVRFTKIDEGIIKNCLLFNIPFFVVRSKADQHIQNMMNDTDECERQVVVGKYVKATRSDFDANLEKMAEAPELDEGFRQMLLNHRVYIVSGSTLRGLFQTMTSEGTRPTLNQSRIIDENLLIEDMLRKAIRRRYSRQAT